MNQKRPRDWTAPIDYRNGTVHIHTEVIEKPAGSEPTTWSLCYIPNKGQKNGYGCTGTVVYKEKGVYEQDVSMKSFWENDSIIWSEGIKQMDLVIKDGSGERRPCSQTRGFGKILPDQGPFTMVQVSAGSNAIPAWSQIFRRRRTLPRRPRRIELAVQLRSSCQPSSCQFISKKSTGRKMAGSQRLKV